MRKDKALSWLDEETLRESAAWFEEVQRPAREFQEMCRRVLQENLPPGWAEEQLLALWPETRKSLEDLSRQFRRDKLFLAAEQIGWAVELAEKEINRVRESLKV